MGSGKTSAAINQMNEDRQSNYIFITPFLSEVKRIKEKCCSRYFVEPEHKGNGKLNNLIELIDSNKNIASTHALFQDYNDTVKEKIRDGNYKLILDEVFNVLEPVNITVHDYKMLLDTKTIHVDQDGYIVWDKAEYDGGFNTLMKMAQSHNVIVYKESLFFWLFPCDVFEAFSEVYILTYMFEAQIQSYYYKMYNINYQYLYVNSGYHFIEEPQSYSIEKEIKDKIHILNHTKAEKVGQIWTDLSSSWFKRENKKPMKPTKDDPEGKKVSKLVELKNNLHNVFNNQFKSFSNSSNMWTTFEDSKPKLSGKGYKNSFVAVNARSTNEHRERKYLAYCANMFFNPNIKKYFECKGVKVLEEQYALSEMLQWIWRSAIRDRNEIWIYIPSYRMKSLLINWLASL